VGKVAKPNKRMRENFDRFHRTIQKDLKLLLTALKENIAKNEMKLIDAKALVKIIVSSFVQWIFDMPWQDEWEFVLEATNQWRKDIAQKGEADMKLKERVVKWCVSMIKQSKHYELFGEKWSQPEYFSIILQPFIISPAINFLDIAVSCAAINQTSKSKNITLSIETIIDKSLHDLHPFPILERYLSKSILGFPANTVVFIPFDRMLKGLSSTSSNVRSIAFGAGDRACPGQLIAKKVLVVLLEHSIDSPNFRPDIGHFWSGRQNDDKDTPKELLYQLSKLSYVIFCLVLNVVVNRLKIKWVISIVMVSFIPLALYVVL
jgi:hypothetical protein